MTGEHNKPVQAATGFALTRLQEAHASMQRRAEQDRGASMVEYALLLVLVLLVAFFSVKIFGDSLVALFDSGASTMENAPNVGP